MRAEQVAALWGCSAWTVYEMRKAGSLPVEPLTLGRSLVWPTVPCLRSVGIDPAMLFTGTASETAEAMKPDVDPVAPVLAVVPPGEAS